MSLTGDTAQLETRPLMPAFGVEILDVDIAAADRETLSEVATLLFRHGAIVLRGQSLDQAVQLAFTKVFGAPAGNGTWLAYGWRRLQYCWSHCASPALRAIRPRRVHSTPGESLSRPGGALRQAALYLPRLSGRRNALVSAAQPLGPRAAG